MDLLNLRRVGAACAVLYTVAVIVLSVVEITSGVADATSTADLLVVMVDHKTAVAIGASMMIVGPIFVSIAGVAFFQALHEAGSGTWVALVAFSGGGLLTVYRGFVYVAMTLDLAPAYASASGDSQVTILAVAETLDRFASGADIVGAALIPGVGVAMFSLALLRTGLAPRWVAWLGFFVAVVGGWMTVLSVVSDVFELIGSFGFIGLWVWMVAMAVAVLRAPDTEMESSRRFARAPAPVPGV